ncbi:hypothetical protein [Bergeyella cardium]|uniref:Uncharacterized protein n=1 Tax=Bergeyella cardium TaxID=1585976 RepID=A0A6P1QTZ6_9FLAO|nr:hypothetical protein [Bergeyella cardium]QHN64513.1 hypothetical protein DBX24_00715 [Bergeyella cardium]WHE33805.1 hypothetical protein P8603_00715 [Bergeyella cardium]WHF60455.1 hypothetical protein O0R51_00715 [Bergeyella cardium]
MKTLSKKTVSRIFILTLSLFTTYLFSQTEKDILNMKNKTDTTALKKLSENLKKNKMSKEELQRKAKELGIPYSGNANGSYFELQGFDPNGMPIYYTTMSDDHSPSNDRIAPQSPSNPKKSNLNNCKKALKKSRKAKKSRHKN